MTFLSPGRLWLLALVPAIMVAYVLVHRQGKRSARRFTNPALLANLAPRRPGWLRHVSAGLFMAAMCVMIVAYARPASAVKVPRERATIMVAIDVSLSMEATDVTPTRVQAAKTAAKTFVESLPQRFNVGLVSFAGNAAAVTAPTLDHQAVADAIDRLQLGRGTAIGEAVFTCLSSIRVLDARAGQDPPPAHIVLMSDGANTQGRSVDEAATAARTAKVPVSTIAFGTPNGTVTIDGQTYPVPPSTTTLRGLAADTGGTAYQAQAGEQLSEIYQHIGHSLGYTTQRRETTAQYAFAALLLALAAGGASLLWYGRLP
jgi:Ca-activated chloride channel family protein